MTFNGLYSEVLELGFECSAYPVSSILSAANRALATLYSERRLRRRAYLKLAELPPKVPLPDRCVTNEQTLRIPDGGVSLSAFGKGRITVRDKDGERRYAIDGQAFIRERVRDGEIIAYGEDTLELTDISSYPGYCGRREALPAAGKRRLELKKLIPDFGALTSAPTDGSGFPVSAEIYGGTLLLPERFSGELVLEYLPIPKPVSDTEGFDEIDIPRELEVLLPLLTAAYVWLDAEEEKSRYYMERYRELSAAIPDLSGRRTEKYITNGWA